MVQYQKPAHVAGAWVDKKTLKNGTRCKIVEETVPMPSSFKNDKTGEFKTRDVTKLRIEGVKDPVNVELNKPTLVALIDAFGTESKMWCNKMLTMQVENAEVGGKRVKKLYLIPEGFEVGEDSGGYVVVKRIGAAAPEAASTAFEEAIDQTTPTDDEFGEPDIQVRGF